MVLHNINLVPHNTCK